MMIVLLGASSRVNLYFLLDSWAPHSYRWRPELFSRPVRSQFSGTNHVS